jgi:glycosyltransferase 2 family protein
VRGVIGRAPGTFPDYVTAYAWPYILGYLAILLPGGLGVRDSALAVALGALKLATPPQAVVVTVTSRLWLTVLELVPGFIYLARGMR